MPSLKNYRLFISHSWAYGDAYEKLVKFFKEYPNFKWSNYSVPKDDPVHDADNDTQLYNAITFHSLKKIRVCLILLA